MKILSYLIMSSCIVCILSFLFTTEISYKDDPSVAIVFCLRVISCPSKPLSGYSDKYIYITTPDESYVMRDFYILNQKYGYIFIILMLFLIGKIAKTKDNKKINSDHK